MADKLHAKKPAEEVQHKGEVNALERLMAKKRKAETPSVAHAFLKPDQQLKAREALADFFLEASEAVAVNFDWPFITAEVLCFGWRQAYDKTGKLALNHTDNDLCCVTCL